MLHECEWIDVVRQLFQGPADDPPRFNHLRLHFAEDQAGSRWVKDLTALATAAGSRARRSAARKRHPRPVSARTGTLLLAPATWLEHHLFACLCGELGTTLMRVCAGQMPGYQGETGRVRRAERGAQLRGLH